MSTAPASNHRWKFARIGALDQVVLQSAEDILNLDSLDQKLWVALSCPVQGIELDEKTLALIDTDGDGRIRVPELLAAIKWLAARTTDISAILRPATPGAPSDALALDRINAKSPEGAALLASARNILSNLGLPPDTPLTIAATSDTKKIFSETRFNGDGIIPAGAAATPELEKLITEIIATQGAETDLSGKPGINQARADAFFADIAAHAAWSATARQKPEILALGDATPAALAALKTVRAKIDDYFTRCRLAAFDPRTLASLNRAESDYLPIIAHDLRATADELAGFPVSKIAADQPPALPLATGVNPAWSAALAAFVRDTITPVFGAAKTSLAAAEWESLNAKLAPYETWLATKAGSSIEALGDERIKEIAGNAGTLRAGLAALFEQDKALEPEARAIADVDRLVRYHAHLGTLLRNFVNFADFFQPGATAVFQAGVLYLDSRSCELCVRVADPAAHSVLASLSKACIAYCDLKRPNGETMKIAACFTQGNSDFLMVGRNGIFYDRKGRDWDATITKLVDNPISLREAFWSPYKKFIRMIEEMVAKRAAAADAASTEKLTGAATQITTIDQQPAAPGAAAPSAATPKKIDVGTVAALGVAVGAITGAIAAMATGIAGLSFWQIPLIPVVLLLIISGPSVFIAWLKLRQRTLGPILDATGWAINGRIKINLPLGTSLTGRAELPEGAQRTLKDPFEDKAAKRRRRRIILWVLLLALAGGAAWTYLDRTHREPPSWFWERL